MDTRWRYHGAKRGGGINGFIRNRGKKPKSVATSFIPRLNGNGNHEERDDREAPPIEMNLKDYQDETILCFSYASSLLGAAIYEQSTQIVRVMNDISEDSTFEYIKRLIDTINPSIILANNSQDMKLINMLTQRYGSKEDVEENARNQDLLSDSIPRWDPSITTDETDTRIEEDPDSDEEFDNSSLVKFIKLTNNFYRFKKSMDRLNELFNADDVTSTEEERELMVKMRIDMNSTNMIRSFGALLFYLDETRLGVENAPLNVRSPVKAIKTFVLGNHVEIDFNTFKALDIMHCDEKRKKGVPQKYSIFALLNRCKSTMGRRCLKKWCRNPTTSREILKIRHKFIHFFLQDCHRPMTAKIVRLLNHVKGLDHIFHRFQTGTAELIHWDGFIQTISALCEIIEALQLTALREHIFEEHVSIRDISELIVIIKSIIDFEESRTEGRVAVCVGVDNYLDEYKYTFRALPSVLTSLAEQEAERLGISGDDNCTCVYVPLIGYLISLPKTFPIHEHEGIQLVYETDSEFRIKNETTEYLEEEIGDIRMQIIDREASIILRLKKMILQKKRKILSFLNIASQIDVYIALGLVASELGWNCPSLVEESIIEAMDLNHPLAAKITKNEFVSNRVVSGSDGTRVSIITGPNACGKSVYMKQVGVLVFLAHIGSFVPARHAKIGPVDRIVTRMFTVDTVLDGMSTFAKDVEQVAVALRKATNNSLVIVDEFGKGTMMEVGLSLLASTLTYWIEKGAEKCPHIFISSHFHALPKYIPVENNMVAFLTFRVNRLAGGRTEYSFKLVEGVVDCSFAMSVAKDEGIDIEDVGRACQIYASIKDGASIASIQLKSREESGECEDGVEKNCDQVLEAEEDQDLMDVVEKIQLRKMENVLKTKAKRTLADDNLVGDTRGVDKRMWDSTQNLLREDENITEETQMQAEKTEKWISDQRKPSNLSVSFAITSKSGETKEPSDLFQYLEDAFGKEKSPEKSANSPGIQENLEKPKQVAITRQETPPSPTLFSDDDEEEEEERTVVLTEESISSAPIFSTPQMEAARKRMKLDLSSSKSKEPQFKTPISISRNSNSPAIRNAENLNTTTQSTSAAAQQLLTQSTQRLESQKSSRTETPMEIQQSEYQTQRSSRNSTRNDLSQKSGLNSSRSEKRFGESPGQKSIMNTSRSSVHTTIPIESQQSSRTSTPSSRNDLSQKSMLNTSRSSFAAETPIESQKSSRTLTPASQNIFSQKSMLNTSRSSFAAETPMESQKSSRILTPADFSQKLMNTSRFSVRAETPKESQNPDFPTQRSSRTSTPVTRTDLSQKSNISRSSVHTAIPINSQKSSTPAIRTDLSQKSRSSVHTAIPISSPDILQKSILNSSRSSIRIQESQKSENASRKSTTFRTPVSSNSQAGFRAIPISESMPFETSYLPPKTSRFSPKNRSSASTPIAIVTPNYSNFRPVIKRSEFRSGLMNRSVFDLSATRKKSNNLLFSDSNLNSPAAKNLSDSQISRQNSVCSLERRSNITPQNQYESPRSFSIVTSSSQKSISSRNTPNTSRSYVPSPSSPSDEKFEFEMNANDPIYGNREIDDENDVEPMDVSENSVKFSGFSQEHAAGDFSNFFEDSEKSLFIDSQD